MAICRCFDPLGRPWPKIPKQPTRGAAGHFYIVLCHWQIRGHWRVFEPLGTAGHPIGGWTLGTHWLWCSQQVAGEECFLAKRQVFCVSCLCELEEHESPLMLADFILFAKTKESILGQQRRERSSKLAKLADYYFALLSLARVSLEAQTRVQGVFFSRPAWRTPDHGSQRHHPPAGTKRSGRCWGNSEVALLCSQGYLVPATVNLFNRPSRPIRGV